MIQFINDIKNAIKKNIDKSNSEINSKRYQDAIKHTKRLILEDYVSFIRSVSFATLRGKEIYDQFLCIRFHDVYLESVVGIYYLIEQGFLNQAKRELRYLLEANMKHWFVDQEMMKSTFDEKIQNYENIVPQSTLDFVKDFKHYVSVDNEKFFASTKSIYKDLCSYVHASKSQTEERIKKSLRNEYLGFTSAKEIEDINKLIFRTLELCIICQFNACGPSTVGDLFIHDLDSNKNWKFHKSIYIKEVSQSYDYKHERKKE